MGEVKKPVVSPRPKDEKVFAGHPYWQDYVETKMKKSTCDDFAVKLKMNDWVGAVIALMELREKEYLI